MRVGDQLITASHIVIATGGKPRELDVAGHELTINSDQFFQIEKQPKKVAVLGAGYIAVELAGVFHGLGTDTSLFVRGATALRNFDPMVCAHLDVSMKKAGMHVVSDSNTEKITREADGSLTLHFTNGTKYGGFEYILNATGRVPLVEALNLSGAGIATGRDGYISVDEYQNTSVPGVYALGDVCGKVELTPMAIAAGRRLADRLFGGMENAKADYENVPTVVFSHPTIATVGLTETEAKEKFGETGIKVYTSGFVNLYYGCFFGGEAGDKPISKVKLICAGENEKVVGLHMIGMGVDEIMQGFGVAIKMGATKADFDSCVAIHPTASEELVTLPPWGLSAHPNAAKF